jgi:hypothetical protein
LMRLQEKIDSQSVRSVRWYDPATSERVPMPVLGPDLLDPRDLPKIRAQQKAAQEAVAQPAAPAPAQPASVSSGSAS